MTCSRCCAPCASLYYQIGCNGPPLCPICWARHNAIEDRKRRRAADQHFARVERAWRHKIGL